MLKLSKSAQQKAISFIETQARPLEQSLYEYYFQSGSPDTVVEELARFQNQDGGFGRGLEADLRLPGSSVIATTVGLQILRELGAQPDHPLGLKAIGYLLSTLDQACMAWPRVPPAVESAPHAPWWNHKNNQASQGLDNPRPEIVGYFFDYSHVVPAGLRNSLLSAVIERLEGLPETTTMHDDLLCYVRLADTATLPQELRNRIMRSIEAIAARSVSRDPSVWHTYAFRPLNLVTHPGSLCASQLADIVQVNLDYEIEHQGQDGAWCPYWSWGGAYPEAWQTAEREWKGVLTLKTLRTLEAFGRLG